MGEWSVFTGENDLKAFDRYLDEKGYVEAHDLTKLFSTVRANDLIWSSVVNHYLLGDEARASDLLWWFDDGSRIPARMLKEYGAPGAARQPAQGHGRRRPSTACALDLSARSRRR